MATKGENTPNQEQEETNPPTETPEQVRGQETPIESSESSEATAVTPPEVTTTLRGEEDTALLLPAEKEVAKESGVPAEGSDKEKEEALSVSLLEKVLEEEATQAEERTRTQMLYDRLERTMEDLQDLTIEFETQQEYTAELEAIKDQYVVQFGAACERNTQYDVQVKELKQRLDDNEYAARSREEELRKKLREARDKMPRDYNQLFGDWKTALTRANCAEADLAKEQQLRKETEGKLEASQLAVKRLECLLEAAGNQLAKIGSTPVAVTSKPALLAIEAAESVPSTSQSSYRAPVAAADLKKMVYREVRVRPGPLPHSFLTNKGRPISRADDECCPNCFGEDHQWLECPRPLKPRFCRVCMRQNTTTRTCPTPHNIKRIEAAEELEKRRGGGC